MSTHTRPMQWLLAMEAQDNPWRGTLPPHEQDTEILSEYHHEDMDNFENVEHENHTT